MPLIPKTLQYHLKEEAEMKFEMPEIKIIKFSRENIVTASAAYDSINEYAEAVFNAENESEVSAIFRFQL